MHGGAGPSNDPYAIRESRNAADAATRTRLTVNITFSSELIWLCEIIAEVVLFVLLTYVWARPLRWLIGAVAIMDVVKWAVHNDIRVYANLWVAWRTIEVCWLAYLACHFLTLLTPKLRDGTVVRIPYAIVVSAAILNGPPHTMEDFYAFQRFGLLVVIFTVCYGVFTAVQIRFEDMTCVIGLLAALQVIAGEVMLGMGYHPKLGQMCWLLGVLLLVHTTFTYEPDEPTWPSGGGGHSWRPSRDIARL